MNFIKKERFIALFFCLSVSIVLVHAQVGINTESPKATLDIVKSSSTTSPDGLLVPRLTLSELNSRSGNYSSAQNGAIIYVTDVTGDVTSSTKDVQSIGLYYYNAALSKWSQLGSADAVNIYNSDGSLSGNRKVDLNSKNLVFANTGNVGIGVNSPTNKLHISAPNPIRIDQVNLGDEDVDRILVIDANGVVKHVGTISQIISNFGTPAPALFELGKSIDNFLETADLGYSQIVPMNTIKNEIPGLSINSAGTEISFPPGTYQISFVYEALHNADCTISSYFIDFPIDSGDTRIHSTAAHDTGSFSNHGGTITFVTTLSKPTKWKIELGRGQSGNCTGVGMTLIEESTQLLIYRMGD